MYFLKRYKRGVFNRYRRGMPWTEMALKDFRIVLQSLGRLIMGKPAHRWLVYPHFPSRGSTIYRIARVLGIEITNHPGREFDLAVYWEYATIRKEFELLENLPSCRVVNLYSRNISKDFVDQKMHEVFGYSTRIEPDTYVGEAVRKSLTNAVHDGTLITCPLRPEQGFIYQKFIRSDVNDHEVMDLRVPVMMREIPHIYLNYRKRNSPFKNVPDRAELCTNPNDYLTEDEMEGIVNFCELCGLEFCELDVLRDKNDGRIYIVDANNTPQGPPKHLPKSDKLKAIESLGACFQRVFMAVSA